MVFTYWATSPCVLRQHAPSRKCLNSCFRSPCCNICTLKVWHLLYTEWTADWDFVVKWTCKWWREALEGPEDEEAATGKVPQFHCGYQEQLESSFLKMLQCLHCGKTQITNRLQSKIKSGGTSARATTVVYGSVHPNYKNSIFSEVLINTV